MEKLVTHYPKKEYWVDLLSRVQRKPGFSDRLALDAYRLSLATGSMTAPADYMEMAQLALQAGFPAEASRSSTRAIASGALGTGAQAERAQAPARPGRQEARRGQQRRAPRTSSQAAGGQGRRRAGRRSA